MNQPELNSFTIFGGGSLEHTVFYTLSLAVL